MQTPTAEIRTALHLITRSPTLLYSAPQSYTILQNTSQYFRPPSYNIIPLPTQPFTSQLCTLPPLLESKTLHLISRYISPQARDLDTGRNAEVRLSIVAGNGDGKFRIDPITGMLYVAAALDAEKKTRYTLTVAALDQANAGVRKQSSARVRILVTDVNDNQPKFPRDQKTIYFDENEPGRTRVTRVNAKDADSGENQQISYSIANPDADEIPFVIDHSNGVIKSTRLVDYESDRREYKLQVGSFT